jgi:hypothetical protein
MHAAREGLQDSRRADSWYVRLMAHVLSTGISDMYSRNDRIIACRSTGLILANDFGDAATSFCPGKNYIVKVGVARTVLVPVAVQLYMTFQ